MRYYFLIYTLIWLSLLGVASADVNTPIGSFAISPAKYDISVAAGASATRQLFILNNLGYDADFLIQAEDVAGTKDSDQPIAFFGSGIGPYSLKNYLQFDQKPIRVKAGETVSVPINISIPKNAVLPGLYGGVFVSEVKSGQKSSGARMNTRLGSLFYVRTKIEAVYDGRVEKFSVLSSGKSYQHQPVTFQVVYANTGNVHQMPFGFIEIKNSSGQVVDKLPVERIATLPNSIRNVRVTWSKTPWFGSYTAILHLQDAGKEIALVALPLSLWPWYEISIIGLGLLVIFIFYWFRRRNRTW